MKAQALQASLFSAILILSAAATGCGSIEKLTSNAGNSTSTEVSSEESENATLMDASLSAAAGSEDPSLRPFRMDGLSHPAGMHEGRGPRGKGHGPGGRGHGPGGRGPHAGGPGGKHNAIPAEIQTLMKAADSKRDSVLGIDRAKVDEVLAALKTDLEALRAVSPSREEFQAQAKVLHDKYTAQLKTILPAFDTLTTEQKARVKAIHDLQKGVIDSCVARGADAASAACTTAKSALQANIDAP